MSGDNFMMDVLSGEFISAAAAIEEAGKSPVASKAAESALRSLKGAARMLGFENLAKLCENLESAFGKNASNTAISPAAKYIASLSKCPKAELSNRISSDGEKIHGLLRAFGKPSASAPDPQGCCPHEKSPRASVSAEAAKPENSTNAETCRAKNPQEAENQAASGFGDDIDDSMRALFMSEFENKLKIISSELVSLDGDFCNTAILDSLMRAAHSIKGAARAVGLSPIVELAHQMENCFSAARSGKIKFNSDSLDAILQCSDFLSGLLKKRFSSVNASAVSSLLKRLKAVENGADNLSEIISSGPLTENPLSILSEPAEDGEDETIKISAKIFAGLLEKSAENLVENRRLEAHLREASGIRWASVSAQREIDAAIRSLDGVSGAESAARRLEQLGASLAAAMGGAEKIFYEIGEHSRRGSFLASELYSSILRGKMVPFSELARSFPRAVRDLARACGKKIKIRIDGGKVPIDREMLEVLDSPVNHILRNSCDHGIESPSERAAAGKPETGLIEISARHSSGFFILSIKDDGRGLSERKIRGRIIEKNLMSASVVEKMSREEIFEFLFLPAFTTRDTVSEISGRGFGLDIVRSSIRQAGGMVEISSEEGRGLQLTIQLPVSRSVIKALEADVCGEKYAFPLDRVRRIIRISRSEMLSGEGKPFVDFGGSAKPVFPAREIIPIPRTGNKSLPSGFANIIILSDGPDSFALELDSLPQECELVVRPLDPRLGKVACVSAASTDDEGYPTLIADIDDIISACRRRILSPGGRPDSQISAEKPAMASKKILVADDSSTVRQAQLKILRAAGYPADTAVDGIDAWNSIRLGEYSLLVSDIDMPRLDGFGLLEKIRSSEKYRSLPIIIVSYKDRPSDKIRARELGANSYLSKSAFQDGTYLEKIQELLGGATRDSP